MLKDILVFCGGNMFRKFPEGEREERIGKVSPSRWICIITG